MITPEELKNSDIIEVPVKIGTLRLTGRISNKKSNYPRVWAVVTAENSGGAVVNTSAEFSWKAIANSINSGNPLDLAL